MLEDTDLRRRLIAFRETVIYAEWNSSASDRKHGVLRRAMIDWLIANKPVDIDEWVSGLPPYLVDGTDVPQFTQYAQQIIAILNRYTGRGPRLRIA